MSAHSEVSRDLRDSTSLGMTLQPWAGALSPPLMHLTELNVTDNPLGEIRRAMMAGNLPIKRLLLRRCAIAYIEVGSFRQMTRLRVLDLRDNSLTYFRPESVLPPSLVKLLISRNTAIRFEGNISSSLAKIEWLEMESVGLNTISDNIMLSKARIGTLKLGQNN